MLQICPHPKITNHLAAVGMEDKGTDKEARAEPADMARKVHGWVPKEDGYNSNNMVNMAADRAADKEMDAAAVAAESFNQCHSRGTTIGTTAVHAGMMCRSVTTAKCVTTSTKATKRRQ